MKTTQKGFSVGGCVAINADLSWAYRADVMNVIFDVTDARLVNGEYVYTLKNPNEMLFGIPAADLHEVK